MKKLNVLILLLIIGITLSASAQKYQKTAAGVQVTTDLFLVNIQFYNASIVRVLKSPVGKNFSKESLSVIKNPEKISFSLVNQDNLIKLKSQKLLVSVNLKSGNVTFSTASGSSLLSEQEKSTSFTPFNDAGNQTYSVKQAFGLAKDEAIYGLGQQQRGKMIQRNLTINMVQNNTDDYIPFFLSAKGYGLFWDNYSPTTFKDNPETTFFKSDVGDCIDYYFMYGENADGVIAKMRDLTGQAPMFPLWTYGFFQSKERYKSQFELVDVVKKYRELNVPLDGIIQDWQYWGNNYLWNAMDFLNVEFPDPKRMVNNIHNLNAHMLISIWSSFGPQTKQYHDLDSMKALMNFNTWPQSGSEKWPPNREYPSGVKVYDAYNPAARKLYWDYLNKGLFSVGIDGWWMDSTEPDHLDFKPSDLDNKTYLGSFRKVRNAYPLMTVGGVYDNQRKIDSNKRVFILTRSAFAGQQRYGANTWSGDVFASWAALRNQISAGLNFSLTAIPYWNSDIGGFFLNSYRRKLEDPEYRELYVRWLQFGTFTPMMRSHGADAPREIYQFGKKGDRAYDAIEKFINLRYSLLPYIYSASWDVTKNQSTMMRALVMDFAQDKKALDINDEYMFGKSILVSPVTNAMYVKPSSSDANALQTEDFSNVKSKQTYLPSGSQWYDFWTNEKLNGGTTTTKETPLDIIPLYVKAGSILPIGPKVQFATEKKWDNLEIRVYPGQNGEFVLYEDENDNYNYEKGAFSTITFLWDDKKQTLTINDRKGSFTGMLNNRKFNISLIGGASKSISFSGKRTTIKF